MSDEKQSCVEPALGPIMPESESQSDANSNETEAKKMLARVGKPAPDFEASAFHEGRFKNIRLSDYKGKWIILCFYPGDFTFV